MFRQLLPYLLVALAIAVHARPASAQAADRSPARATATAIVVNLNTASAAEFEALPGIGARTAARIIEYRQKNGPFKKIEEILESSRFCR